MVGFNVCRHNVPFELIAEHTLDFVLDFDIRQGDWRYAKEVLFNEILSTVNIYPPTSDKNTTSVKCLSCYDYILHLIMSQILQPHNTNYSTIESEDFWFLYHIKSNPHVKLAKFILDNMLKIINKSRTTLIYGMAISVIIDSVGIITRCDPPKHHAMHMKIIEHAINKLGFVYVNHFCVRKEIVNELDIVEDEVRDDTFAELSVAPNTAPNAAARVHPSVGPNFPPMSTTFDFEEVIPSSLSFTILSPS
ncbi:Uncharacterized protein TCM_013537 [Theobroma cacao]|uniref:Uncharacterized protein n=1 Tax=Theobroma cacao TaxID=3641 RepID=A0A061FWH0_THECC|nr:Uncharacterized protein TCM_013537 [Theobroma cacao]